MHLLINYLIRSFFVLPLLKSAINRQNNFTIVCIFIVQFPGWAGIISYHVDTLISNKRKTIILGMTTHKMGNKGCRTSSQKE